MMRLASFVCFMACCGLVLSQEEDQKSLIEKVITFPQMTTSSWAKLHPNESMDQCAVTVCLRFYTDQASPRPCLFSLATQSYPQDFALLWSEDIKQYQMYIHNELIQFRGLTFNLNQWNSVCATWDASSGLAQMFLNDVASIRKAVGSKIAFKGPPVIALGQCQSNYGGGFHQTNIYTGFISNVHIHKQVLTPHQIKAYMDTMIKYKFGDYINWNNLKYTLTGSAQVEAKHLVTFYTKKEQN